MLRSLIFYPLSLIIFWASPITPAIASVPKLAQQAENPKAIDAKKLYDEGIRLYQQQTKESLQQAIDKWKEALVLLRELQDKTGEAVTLNNIGRVYDELGESEKALNFFILCLPLFRQLEDKLGEAVTLNNIGLVNNAIGQKQTAIENFQEASNLFGELNNKTKQASVFSNLALVYEDLANKEKALEYYNQALSLYRELQDKTQENNTLESIERINSQ